MEGFLTVGREIGDAHLVLCGPGVSGVADDPEGGSELSKCYELWRELPTRERRRVHLMTVPMDDLEENAVIVNALQTHARVVTQKSIADAFGLTVTEAMWKGKPIVASNVGGIGEQIHHEQHGLLIDDPRDLADFGEQIGRMLSEPDLAAELGAAAKARFLSEYGPDQHFSRYASLLGTLDA
jgi:trehalose synthase